MRTRRVNRAKAHLKRLMGFFEVRRDSRNESRERVIQPAFPLAKVAGMDSVPGWDSETVNDALGVLGDLPLWQLSPPRWAQVGQTLDQLATAYLTGDVYGFRDAVADLELSGPVRALRIGSTQATGIPEPVLERRNSMVYELTTAAGEKAKPKD